MTVRLLTPAQAGESLGASEMHVRRLVEAGALRAVDIAQPGARSTKIRIRSDDLAAYVEAATLPTLRTGGREPPDSKTSRRGLPPSPGRRTERPLRAANSSA